MKSVIRNLFRSFGFDIVRYHPSDKNRNKGTVKSDHLTLYETATGKYYLPTDATADVVANAIINNQIFEEEVVNCARKYIQPGSVVLDVGANFGQMTLLFSEMVTENGKVYSFDADDFVF